MNKTSFKKLISGTLLTTLLLSNTGFLTSVALAQNQVDVELPRVTEVNIAPEINYALDPPTGPYTSLFGLLPTWSQANIDNSFNNVNRQLKLKGQDQQMIEEHIDYIDVIEDNLDNPYVAQTPNTESVVFNDNFFIKQANALSVDYLNQFTDQEPESVLDMRIAEYVATLMRVNLLDRTGYEHDWVSIKKWIQNDEEVKDESVLADQREEDLPRSSHYTENVMAVQIDQMDYVKCTQIIRNEETCLIQEKKPLDPYKINFGYYTSSAAQSDLEKNSPLATNNFLKQISSNPHQYFNNSAFLMIMSPILENWLGFENANQALNTLNDFPHSGSNAFAFGGLELIKQELDIPETFQIGSDFASTVDNAGNAYLYNMFNKALPVDSFSGPTLHDWLQNIGRQTLSERLFGQPDYLVGEDSETILINIGRRKFEDLLGVKTGTLNKSANSQEELAILLGEGAIEERLNLKLGSFDSDVSSEVQSIIGAEKYNLAFFTNPKLTANMLGLDFNEFTSFRDQGNLKGLKQAVGNQIIAQNIDIYQEYQIPDTENKINSRDLAFNTENYLKPQVNFSDDTITTYKYENNQGITTASYPYGPDSKLYENFTYANQENSIVKNFVAANDLTQTYKQTGIDELAKLLTLIDEDREYVRVWLSTGTFPKKDGNYLLSTEQLASGVNLTDRYDLARLFVEDRPYEVFDRVGREQLEVALDTSVNRPFVTFSANFANTEFNTFVQDRLNRLEELALKLPSDIGDTVISHINIARSAQNDSIAEVINNSQANLISSSLNNIGKMLTAPSVKNTTEANQMITTINEILAGHFFSEVSGLNHTTSSNLEIDVAQVDLDEFLSQPDEDINIDELKQLISRKAIAHILGESNANTENIDTALRNYNRNDAINSIYNLLKPQFDQTAKLLNISASADTADQITGWELTATFCGAHNYLITKISSPIASRNLDISTNNFISFLQGDNNLGSTLDFNQIANTFGTGLANNYENNIRNYVNSFGGADFIVQQIKTGQEFFSGLFAPMPTADNEAVTELANQTNSLIKQLYAGEQIRGVLLGLRDVTEPYLGDGGFQSLYRKDPMTTIKEFSVKSLNDLIGNQLGDASGYTEKLRWLNNLISTPENITSLASDKFSEMLGKFSGNQYNDLLNNLTDSYIKSDITRDVTSAVFSATLNQQDIGFAKNVTDNLLVSGNLIAAGGDYFKNLVADLPDSAQLTSFLNNQISFDNLSAEAQNTLNDLLSENLGLVTLPDGFATQLAQVINGVETTNSNIANVSSLFGNMFDEKILGSLNLTTGTFEGLTNSLGDLNTQISSLTDVLNQTTNLEQLLQLQDVVTNLQGQMLGTIDNVLNVTSGSFSSLVQSLGLTTNFMNGILGGSIPNVLTSITNLASTLTASLLSDLLGGIGLNGIIGSLFSGGFFGSLYSIFSALQQTCKCGYPLQEIWCAMDYYPYLQDQTVYTVPFEEEVGVVDEQGLDRYKATVGDWSATPDNQCITQLGITGYDCIVPVCITNPFETHGKGEFKLDANSSSAGKLKEKLVKAAKFKLIQLIGESLQIPDDTGISGMLPSQIKAPTDEVIEPYYNGTRDRLYGVLKVNKDSGEIEEVVKTWYDRLLDQETNKAVWSVPSSNNKVKDFLYVSY